jgi:hypothetical protein
MIATNLVEAAREYARRGLSVIPLRGKTPAVPTWKVYQSVRIADDEGLAKWFSRADVTGIGIILGRVSGDLFVRDFDDPDAYRRWAESHAELASTMTTVRTARGAHVYGRWKGTKPATFDDGELRAEGQYVAAPPSAHPTGIVYAWVVPLPDGDVPEVDPAAAGLLAQPAPELWGRAHESTESTESTESPTIASNSQTLKLSTSRVRADDLDTLIEAAIKNTLPTENGQRHRRLFVFVRYLYAIPALADVPVKELKPIVRRWFDAALPAITTRDFDVTWGEFSTAWGRVRWGIGDGPIMEATRRAATAEPPACAAGYGPNLRMLVAILRELQRASGDSPIFLSGAKAAELVGVDRGTGTRYLQSLVADGVLEVVERPPRGAIRAIRYRYRGD